MDDLKFIEKEAENITGLKYLTAGVDNNGILRIVDLKNNNIGHAWYNNDSYITLNIHISKKYIKK